MTPLLKLLAAAGLAVAGVASAAAEPAGRLVLYTSQPNEDAQATVDAFRAKYPAVEVEWFREGTTKVMAKLEAEFAAGAPQPDLLLIADTVTMEGLKQAGRLMAHPDADVSAYDPAIMDPDRTYFSTKLITTGIVTNANSDAEVTSWTDLVDPALEGQVVMPSPLTSGAALVHVATLAQHPDFGWGYVERLAANRTIAQGGNGAVFRAVAGGEKTAGIVIDYLPIREKAAGAPVEFVFPDEGVSAVTEPVAILSTAANPEAAKAFVDFLLSPEGQELARAQGYIPAHPDVALPEGFPDRSQIRLMPFDAAAALASAEADKLRFAELFGAN